MIQLFDINMLRGQTAIVMPHWIVLTKAIHSNDWVGKQCIPEEILDSEEMQETLLRHFTDEFLHSYGATLMDERIWGVYFPHVDRRGCVWESQLMLPGMEDYYQCWKVA